MFYNSNTQKFNVSLFKNRKTLCFTAQKPKNLVFQSLKTQNFYVSPYNSLFPPIFS